MTTTNPAPEPNRRQRIETGRPTPGDLATLDQARAEATDDLGRLRSHYRYDRQYHDESAVVSTMVHGLLDAPEWTELELATALVEAIVLLEDV